MVGFMVVSSTDQPSRHRAMDFHLCAGSIPARASKTFNNPALQLNSVCLPAAASFYSGRGSN